jgi:RNA polymerase sigma factor (sigma-70 family)
MADEPEHLLLRRYHAARALGNDTEAARAWERLTLRNFDRITGLCASFRFAGGTGLPAHETGSAATEAYLRAIAMGAAFDGREIGQYRAALVRVVWNTCHDYGRKELRHQKRSRSLDTTWDDDGEGGPYDAALARYDEHLRAEAEEAAEAETGREEAGRLARWAIAQVRNDKHRAVLELTWLEKLDAEAIAERLGISVDNVYQRRRRGLIELERILRAPRD